MSEMLQFCPSDVEPVEAMTRDLKQDSLEPDNPHQWITR